MAVDKKGEIHIDKNEIVIALAGNPNVGKSTVFNYITGLNQHTGNWTGKTVSNAYGRYKYNGKNYVLVDLPGTYSLIAHSKEEEVARDFICFEHPDAVIIVLDATALERNLNLALQVLEVTNKVVLCVNLVDEAARKGIRVDIHKMREKLCVPIVATSAKTGLGIEELLKEAEGISKIKCCNLYIPQHPVIEQAISLLMPYTGSRWISLKLLENDHETVSRIYRNTNITSANEKLEIALKKAGELIENEGFGIGSFKEKEVEAYYKFSENLVHEVVSYQNLDYNERDRKIDKILTSKTTGIPIMLGFLALILWITIVGANYPSQILSDILFGLEKPFALALTNINFPTWLIELLVTGMYRTLAWVVSVMLPPMAIFFPLFTLLEDLGYLPRIAFNLDRCFCKARAHGKQSLTMCMGFGCNAVGVTGTGIIDSPRERLIAILTNNFVPCNGRFPTIITLATIFIVGGSVSWIQSSLSAFVVFLVILLGVFMTFVISRILSATVLKGLPSGFTLELPPYRKPKIWSILIRSLLDRTIFVLGRAVSVAAPTGIVIWILANTVIGDMSVLTHIANFLDPFARLFGFDGYILLAFILGFPANEIVVPIILMSYMSGGSLISMDNLETMRTIFMNHNWTMLTAINVILFMLMHYPCATTMLTIKKETKSWKWTFLAFLIPTVTGLLVCFITTTVAKIMNII